MKRAGIALAFVAAARRSCRACTPSQRRRRRRRTASGKPLTAARPTTSPPTARSTGTRSRASAATIPNATPATGRTARARPMRRAWSNRSKTMSYPDFMLIVATGREVIRADKQSKMPALGDNPQRAVLPRRHLRLPEGARRRRAAARPPGQAGREARRRRKAREGLLRVTGKRTAALVAVLLARVSSRLRAWRKDSGSTSSTARRCGSAPTPPTCRSRTTRARASRTRLPTSSRPSSRSRSSTPGFRRPPASSARPCSPGAATW